MATRQEVYQAIDTERDYQIRETANPNRPDMIEEFGMGDALGAISVILRKADDIWYKDSEPYQNTIDQLRKIAGVCVRIGEKYGMPQRQ